MKAVVSTQSTWESMKIHLINKMIKFWKVSAVICLALFSRSGSRKLISAPVTGSLEQTPKDVNLATKSIQHQVLEQRQEVVIQWKGKWGSFPPRATFCPDGSFVFGYRVRSEAPQGNGDDTALNDIELYCRRPNSNAPKGKIWSAHRTLGSWSPDKYCIGTDNPVIGFDVQEERVQGSEDDTALNAVDLWCKKEDLFQHL
eukprot:TRINITY_DN786_c0_g1_i5.p1 TRINITY_DN786_c0_g1~~TRINITY_DN786_c0_g1_i5.p1  ORF type:complete len:200 (-),score=37.29 TRINITY_DN786_c0_g1_i5:471-1070(-)